jgi:hypothetical protein
MHYGWQIAHRAEFIHTATCPYTLVQKLLPYLKYVPDRDQIDTQRAAVVALSV